MYLLPYSLNVNPFHGLTSTSSTNPKIFQNLTMSIKDMYMEAFSLSLHGLVDELGSSIKIVANAFFFWPK